MRHTFAGLVAVVLLVGVGALPAEEEEGGDSSWLVLGGSNLPLRGTSLSGAEFGNQVPGKYAKDYVYPTDAEVTAFLKKGMTTLRLPFRWERLQPALKQPLDPTEANRIDAFVRSATGKGARVVLDPHNYARYYDQVVGAGVPDDAFADLWSRLATRFGSNPLVVFGLMNEPHDLPAEQWARSAQAAILAIRATKARNLILVPGVAWSGAWSWAEPFYGTPNAQAMTVIHDPLNNDAFEVHQYLDANRSGTDPECVSRTVGSESMKEFTAWLRRNGRRGFLGELGAGPNPTCIDAVNDQLAFLEQNSDVYLGWTWWSAGPWWGDYFLSIEPHAGVDAPMMTELEKHLAFPPSSSVKPLGATPLRPDGSGLGATLKITSDWKSGYCADVRVHNGGFQAVKRWSVVLDARSSTLTQAWNVLIAKNGPAFTVTPAAWNATIPPGGAAEWGFCAREAFDEAKAAVVSVSQ